MLVERRFVVVKDHPMTAYARNPGLRSLSHRHILMVAAGTGLAPMLSMLADQIDNASERTIRLWLGVRTADDLFGLDRRSRHLLRRVHPALV
jgi:NAD(P)H-flavin reductase